MALSVDWLTKVIFVPKADTTLIQSSPTEIRELDLNAFRLNLKDIEDDEGMPYVDTHRHNTSVSIGGLSLARVIEIINGYTVTFEDGQYAVNLTGANSNIGDVVNVNQVSIRSANSAGLVEVGSGLDTNQDAILTFLRDWAEADEEVRAATYRRLHKDTKVPLVTKDVTQSGTDIDLVEPP